jgi:hypothetical protein
MMMAFLMWVAITAHTYAGLLLNLLVWILPLMLAAFISRWAWKATGN